MKKFLGEMTLFLLLMVSVAFASGDGSSALDAFQALPGEPVQSAQAVPAKSAAEYLDAVMSGAYAAPTADTADALAADLTALSQISMKDMAAYSSAKGLSVTQVRNSYYRALSQALRADIMLHPAAQGDEQSLQTLLSLFLEGDALGLAERETIRASMNDDKAEMLAQRLRLPQRYVEFLIMNENWNDQSWTNDEDWKNTYIWTDYEDSPEDLSLGSRDSANSTRVAQLQERLIALGYLTGKADGIFGEKTKAALIQYQRANGIPATGVYDDSDDDWMRSADVVMRWDYEDSFMDTPDHTPDNTPDRKPDNTPDNTPDRKPDNTPDNTPDRTRDNTPDRDNS